MCQAALKLLDISGFPLRYYVKFCCISESTFQGCLDWWIFLCSSLCFGPDHCISKIGIIWMGVEVVLRHISLHKDYVIVVIDGLFLNQMQYLNFPYTSIRLINCIVIFLNFCFLYKKNKLYSLKSHYNETYLLHW